MERIQKVTAVMGRTTEQAYSALWPLVSTVQRKATALKLSDDILPLKPGAMLADERTEKCLT
jgi:hypothetical protein